MRDVREADAACQQIADEDTLGGAGDGERAPAPVRGVPRDSAAVRRRRGTLIGMNAPLSFELPTAAVVEGARVLALGAGAALVRDRNRRIRELHRRGRIAVDALRGLAAIGLGVDTEQVTFDEADEDRVRDEVRLQWLAWLVEIREAHALLESPLHHAFARALEREVPELAAALAEVYPRAVERTKQLRAFAAVMAGERDDIEMGMNLIPPVPRSEWRGGPSISAAEMFARFAELDRLAALKKTA